jgi:hypothetical protein
MKIYGCFKNLVLIAAVTLSLTGCGNKSSKDGWVDLFDGKTLNGWRLINQDWKNPDSKPDFYVQDGMLVCNTILGTAGGYLATEKSYDDFILEVDVKMDTSLNSGIQCRGQIWDRDTVTHVFSGEAVTRKWPKGYVWGYQIELDGSNRKWSGGLYEPGNRGWLVTLKNKPKEQAAYKPLDWNHFKIQMQGNHIQSWVNNVPIVDTTDNMASSGFIAIQFHGANRPWQKDAKSYWKNMKIKEL